MEFPAPVPVIEVRRSSLLRTLQGYNSTYISICSICSCSDNIRNIFRCQIFRCVSICSCSGNIRNIFRCQIFSSVDICSCFDNIFRIQIFRCVNICSWFGNIP